MFERSVSSSGDGPAALFALIEAPRRAWFPAEVARRPVFYSAVFLLALLGLTVAFVLAQLRAPLNGAQVDLLPTEAVIILLIGIPAFPLRMILVPIAGYVVVFTLGFALKIWLEPGFIPAGADPWLLGGVSVSLNGAVALVAALGGRAALGLAERDRRWAFRWAEAVLAAVTTLLYFALAALTIRLLTAFVYPADWMEADFGAVDLTGVGTIRAYRIAFCSGVVLLFLLDVPSWPDVRRALAVQPLFLAAAIAGFFGWSLYPTVDMNILTLVTALLLPGYSAILASIIGITTYISFTAAGLVQGPIDDFHVAALEAISLVLMAVNYFLLLFRHQAALAAGRARQTMGRMQRVHEFATIGYFIFDVAKARVHVDRVAATILNTAPDFDANAFLERVRPSDRADLIAVMAARRTEATLTAFSIAAGDHWVDDAPGTRHLAIYSWYERLRDGRTVIAYGALRDRTDEHDRAAALGKALADLSEQQSRQTQLFSIVSHEIRTPASVISMLIEEMDGGATWAQMGPRLRAVSEQLLSVLADMRQTVRPEENLPIRMESFRPQELAETVRNTFLLMAEARGVDLVLNLSEGADEDRISDRVRLNQVLSNLVKNALIHADCRRITISYAERCGGDDLTAIWRVSDDGRGIPAAERPRLFQPFSRMEGTGHARADGSGLGLYVTKTSVELLGGTVDYTEVAPHGSEFVLTLPAGRGVPRAPAMGPDKADLVHGFGKVLVVEDSDLIGELLVARLRRLIPQVIWARSGFEGLEVQAREAPDLILTDLFMPRMGGDEMTAALRARGVTVPIIGMTAAAIGDERATFEQAGTDFVLTKPVSTAQLIDALARLREQSPDPVT